MPDNAIGADVIPPNPMAGINAYSGILGIQQQKLALQTGQAELQTAQAQATVAQRTAKENQNLAQLVQDPIGNGIIDKDGNSRPPMPNRSFLGLPPTTGASHYADIVNAAQKRLNLTTQ